MSTTMIFQLPDLGEGIPEAEIHQWHVNVGDTIDADTVLVSMETAKAVVDVPAPFSGTIATLHGNPGDIIHTGNPLVSYTTTDPSIIENEHKQQVVAAQQTASPTTSVQTNAPRDHHLIQTLPAVRVLATHLGVDLTTVNGTGVDGMITPDDVKQAAAINTTQQTHSSAKIPDSFEPVRGVRRQMAQTMTVSHNNIVPVTLVDDADLTQWDANNDITVRVVRAIVFACQQEPALNAWFDGNAMARQCHFHIDLGIAIDSDEGLFVPILRHADSLSNENIRTGINELKHDVKNRSIAPELLRDPTITLSNFGVFAGRYATPVVVPPTVAIIATGRIYTTLQQGLNGSTYQQRLLPLSVTVDHRACTGGEVARFLQALLTDLHKKS